MPAKRHGRPGRPGRPSDPVEALRELAGYAIAPTMRALARMAADRGFSLKTLAGAAGIRYAESLSRSILSNPPKADTVRKLTNVLYPKDGALISRALLCELHRLECKALLLQIIDREGQRVFGESAANVSVTDSGKPPRLERVRVDNNPYVVAGNVVSWLEHDSPPAALHEAARAVVLAQHGLNDALEGEPANNSDLGSVLCALERLLAKYRLGSLRYFLRDDKHERALQLEGRALFRGLLHVLAFSEGEEEKLREIIGSKLSETTTTDSASRRFERSVDAMHYAFWNTWNAPDEPERV